MVEGLSPAQFRDIRKLMSYTVATRSRFTRFGSTRKYLIDKHGEFPTGLLYILHKYVADKAIPLDVQDMRVQPKLKQLGLETMFLPSDIVPYPEQNEVGPACLREHRGIVVGPTGVGKSYMLAKAIDALQVCTLVVVPSLSLKTQLTASLRACFGEEMVGPLSLKGQRMHFVTVENVDALDPKHPVKGIDCVITDEFHHSGAETYRKLNMKAWNDIYFRLGFTATPFRAKSEERLLLESVLSRVIYQIPYEVAVRKGYIVPMESYYVDLPAKPLKCRGQHWHSVYSECIVNNEERNRIIVDMAENLHGAGVPALILVKQVDHGVKLRDMLVDRGIFAPFANGLDENSDQLIADFNALKRPILIGTMGKIGEGVDTKPCEYVILAGGGKSRNQFMQNAGRGFRRFGSKQTCKIVLFRDTSHRWLIDHFKECCKTLRAEYGAVPAKLDL